ncbi:MAG TPA: CBS domain-containing protein [Candidatus Omnitrophica bacterium]|nr:CBS domain-containing protein [Candidatus Omnitrophota bacterium]
MNNEKKITKVQELVYELKVRDAMRKDIIRSSPDILMSELGETLRSNRISGTPIVEHDKLVGIISIEDFIKWLAEGGKDCPIESRMTRSIKTLYDDEPLVHAIGKLDKLGFGRFPVIDRATGKLLGVITKGDIIESLLRELEIDYHEEEIHRYRASHIFEDIIADKTILRFEYFVKGKDFNRAGEVSSGIRKTLTRLGIHPQIVRRAAIASYEAEINVVSYTSGGEISVRVQSDKIQIHVTDSGPGIPDVAQALKPGYSTAPEWIRNLGFGAGMGLCNIKKCADKLDIESTVGKGTRLKICINMKAG